MMKLLKFSDIKTDPQDFRMGDRVIVREDVEINRIDNPYRGKHGVVTNNTVVGMVRILFDGMKDHHYIAWAYLYHEKS